MCNAFLLTLLFFPEWKGSLVDREHILPETHIVQVFPHKGGSFNGL